MFCLLKKANIYRHLLIATKIKIISRFATKNTII